MKRKLTALILALMLLCTCAVAETADDPFLGTWTVTHYISGGKMLTPGVDDTPDTLFFSHGQDEQGQDVAALMLMSAGYAVSIFEYVVEGTTATAGEMKVTITGVDAASATDGTVTMLLQKSSLNGTWKVDCWVSEGKVTFPDDQKSVITIENSETAQINLNTMTYRGFDYTIEGEKLFRSGKEVGTIKLRTDGLLEVMESDFKTSIFYLEGQEAWSPAAPYLGTWNMIMAMKNGVPVADLAQAQKELLFEKVTLTHAAVKATRVLDVTPASEYVQFSSLCTYGDAGCTVTYEDATITATVDAAGMLTIQYGEWTLMMIRAE